MSSEEAKKQLALYRLQQAEESLDEARYLLAGNKSHGGGYQLLLRHAHGNALFSAENNDIGIKKGPTLL